MALDIKKFLGRFTEEARDHIARLEAAYVEARIGWRYQESMRYGHDWDKSMIGRVARESLVRIKRGGKE